MAMGTTHLWKFYGSKRVKGMLRDNQQFEKMGAIKIMRLTDQIGLLLSTNLIFLFMDSESN